MKHEQKQKATSNENNSKEIHMIDGELIVACTEKPSKNDIQKSNFEKEQDKTKSRVKAKNKNNYFNNSKSLLLIDEYSGLDSLPLNEENLHVDELSSSTLQTNKRKLNQISDKKKQGKIKVVKIYNDIIKFDETNKEHQKLKDQVYLVKAIKLTKNRKVKVVKINDEEVKFDETNKEHQKLNGQVYFVKANKLYNLQYYNKIKRQELNVNCPSKKKKENVHGQFSQFAKTNLIEPFKFIEWSKITYKQHHESILQLIGITNPDAAKEELDKKLIQSGYDSQVQVDLVGNNKEHFMVRFKHPHEKQANTLLEILSFINCEQQNIKNTSDVCYKIQKSVSPTMLTAMSKEIVTPNHSLKTQDANRFKFFKHANDVSDRIATQRQETDPVPTVNIQLD